MSTVRHRLLESFAKDYPILKDLYTRRTTDISLALHKLPVSTVNSKIELLKISKYPAEILKAMQELGLVEVTCLATDPRVAGFIAEKLKSTTEFKSAPKQIQDKIGSYPPSTALCAKLAVKTFDELKTDLKGISTDTSKPSDVKTNMTHLGLLEGLTEAAQNQAVAAVMVTRLKEALTDPEFKKLPQAIQDKLNATPITDAKVLEKLGGTGATEFKDLSTHFKKLSNPTGAKISDIKDSMIALGLITAGTSDDEKKAIASVAIAAFKEKLGPLFNDLSELAKEKLKIPPDDAQLLAVLANDTSNFDDLVGKLEVLAGKDKTALGLKKPSDVLADMKALGLDDKAANVTSPIVGAQVAAMLKVKDDRYKNLSKEIQTKLGQKPLADTIAAKLANGDKKIDAIIENLKVLTEAPPLLKRTPDDIKTAMVTTWALFEAKDAINSKAAPVVAQVVSIIKGSPDAAYASLSPEIIKKLEGPPHPSTAVCEKLGAATTGIIDMIADFKVLSADTSTPAEIETKLNDIGIIVTGTTSVDDVKKAKAEQVAKNMQVRLETAGVFDVLPEHLKTQFTTPPMKDSLRSQLLADEKKAMSALADDLKIITGSNLSIAPARLFAKMTEWKAFEESSTAPTDEKDPRVTIQILKIIKNQLGTDYQKLPKEIKDIFDITDPDDLEDKISCTKLAAVSSLNELVLGFKAFANADADMKPFDIAEVRYTLGLDTNNPGGAPPEVKEAKKAAGIEVVYQLKEKLGEMEYKKLCPSIRAKLEASSPDDTLCSALGGLDKTMGEIVEEFKSLSSFDGSPPDKNKVALHTKMQELGLCKTPSIVSEAVPQLAFNLAPGFIAKLVTESGLTGDNKDAFEALLNKQQENIVKALEALQLTNPESEQTSIINKLKEASTVDSLLAVLKRDLKLDTTSLPEKAQEALFALVDINREREFKVTYEATKHGTATRRGTGDHIYRYKQQVAYFESSIDRLKEELAQAVASRGTTKEQIEAFSQEVRELESRLKLWEQADPTNANVKRFLADIKNEIQPKIDQLKKPDYEATKRALHLTELTSDTEVLETDDPLAAQARVDLLLQGGTPASGFFRSGPRILTSDIQAHRVVPILVEAKPADAKQAAKNPKITTAAMVQTRTPTGAVTAFHFRNPQQLFEGVSDIRGDVFSGGISYFTTIPGKPYNELAATGVNNFRADMPDSDQPFNIIKGTMDPKFCRSTALYCTYKGFKYEPVDPSITKEHVDLFEKYWIKDHPKDLRATVVAEHKSKIASTPKASK